MQAGALGGVQAAHLVVRLGKVRHHHGHKTAGGTSAPEAAARMLTGLPYPLLRQGDAPRATLIDRFRATPGAVLLGTASFWEGVDVPGDALSLVVIDKLPFAPHTDPLVAARGALVAATHYGDQPYVTTRAFWAGESSATSFFFAAMIPLREA